MKRHILILIAIIYSNLSLFSQNVNIPDLNFKNALISAGDDINEDGEISFAEAEELAYLNISGKNISDMTGIESFVNLNILYCVENQLTSLDVSNNTALTILSCSSIRLVNLDVSNNAALKFLNCHDILFTSLDVSNNTSLIDLRCGDNQLSCANIHIPNFMLHMYTD